MNMHFNHKSLSDEAGRMRTFDAFSSLADSDLQRVATVGHVSSVPGGWPLIHEQTPSDSLYILLEGEVDVYYGREQVARLQPGDVIGEAVMRPGTLRNATVSAVSPVRVLHFERAEFTALQNEIPAFRMAVDTIAARHTIPQP